MTASDRTDGINAAKNEHDGAALEGRTGSGQHIADIAPAEAIHMRRWKGSLLSAGKHNGWKGFATVYNRHWLGRLAEPGPAWSRRRSAGHPGAIGDIFGLTTETHRP